MEQILGWEQKNKESFEQYLIIFGLWKESWEEGDSETKAGAMSLTHWYVSSSTFFGFASKPCLYVGTRTAVVEELDHCGFVDWVSEGHRINLVVPKRAGIWWIINYILVFEFEFVPVRINLLTVSIAKKNILFHSWFFHKLLSNLCREYDFLGLKHKYWQCI